MKAKIAKARQRGRRVKASIKVGGERPRVSVYRTNKNFSAQIIDDKVGKVLCSASTLNVKGATNTVEGVKVIAKEVAKKAKEGGVSKVVFDRGSYRYHGRIKAFADSLREEGLQF